METLSHKFLLALAPPRDALYGLALLRAATPAAAETAIQDCARAVFRDFAGEKVSDVPAAMEGALAGSPGQTPGVAKAGSDEPAGVVTAMPADVWARLAAAVQIEAARSADSRALNPDSVLLRPDPLLAPKKSRPREEDDFDLASPARLFTLLGAALLVGIVVTIYIMTRPAAHTAPAATHPATVPGRP